MSRRASLPGAEELFRRTPGRSTAARRTSPARSTTGPAAIPDPNRSTGRQRHDEKITVYVSPEELVELERARLTLRAEHQLAVDRGRIVREAIAVLLADLAAQGPDSVLVRRLLDPEEL